jgi:diguanylate cyclase (GGDEF)-like protein
VLPGVCLIGVNAATELLHRLIKRRREYMYIVSALLQCVVMIYFNPNLHAISSVLFLPILVSVLFLDKRKVIVAGALGCIAECVLYFTSPTHGKPEGDTLLDFLTILLVLAGGTFASLNIIERGIEIWEQLHDQMNTHKELLVRNVVAEKDSKTDELTGLNNRKSLNEYLDYAVRVSRETHTPLYLAVIDIDDFKQVNDQFGHLTGDKILLRTAQAIEGLLEPGDFLARYGGEEFALIIADRPHSQVIAQIESIRERIAQISHVELNGGKTTISVGIATFRYDESQEDLFQRADKCLYQAKNSGKNQTVSAGI